MKSKIICLMIGACLFVTQAPIVFAQTSLHSWAAVQAIAADERLTVKQKDGQTVEGKMIEATDSNLAISRGNKVVNIPRDSIQQIHHSTGKAAKGKWAAIGAGIGAGAGAGIGFTKYSSTRDDYEIYPVMGFIIGAGSGAVAGLAFGASRRKRELIYVAP